MGARQRLRPADRKVDDHLRRRDQALPDGTVAVDNLTLEVPTGTLTVFVGPSGCGKTTSMRMINRMIEPTSGTLTVDGRDVSTVDPVKLRLGIGYVIQSAGLMPHQRVIDNVATVPVLRRPVPPRGAQ
jgi:osmoprotectant transport system ATP-binding protein